MTPHKEWLCEYERYDGLMCSWGMTLLEYCARLTMDNATPLSPNHRRCCRPNTHLQT
jgi:hypothetical protein